MASKVEEVKSALEGLKMVAANFKVPFDTSTLERAVDALVADREEAVEPPKEAPKVEAPKETPAPRTFNTLEK